jgi:hypothetical protein
VTRVRVYIAFAAILAIACVRFQPVFVTSGRDFQRLLFVGLRWPEYPQLSFGYERRHGVGAYYIAWWPSPRPYPSAVVYEPDDRRLFFQKGPS